jgi:N-acetylmuramic acid 6-phosphate etherase
LREDEKISAAILAERKGIERAIQFIVRSFRSGGRLFYVGAGTSGRLGVLDASECPPTFRTDPEMVQASSQGDRRRSGAPSKEQRTILKPARAHSSRVA